MKWIKTKLDVIDTPEIEEPIENLSLSQAEDEIAKINLSMVELSKSIAPYYDWIKRTHKRIEALNKLRHQLEIYITIGITQVAKGVEGKALPKHMTREDVLDYIGTLNPIALAAMAAALGMPKEI